METENKKPETISYYEHEVEIARSEVHAKRWAIAALIAFITLVGTNLGWIIYEAQFQDVVTETYTAESEGGSIAISNKEGSVTYGGTGELQSD